jgi:hypothetical protein
MAKAVVPLARFQEKFGPLDGPAITAKIAWMAETFLHEQPGDKKREAVAR